MSYSYRCAYNHHVFGLISQRIDGNSARCNHSTILYCESCLSIWKHSCYCRKIQAILILFRNRQNYIKLESVVSTGNQSFYGGNRIEFDRIAAGAHSSLCRGLTVAVIPKSTFYK